MLLSRPEYPSTLSEILGRAASLHVPHYDHCPFQYVESRPTESVKIGLYSVKTGRRSVELQNTRCDALRLHCDTDWSLYVIM